MEQTKTPKDVVAMFMKIQQKHSIAEVMQAVGKSENTIRRWAKGKAMPCKSDIDVLKKLTARSQ